MLNKFSWYFLKNHYSYFNELFSTFNDFSEKELLNLSDKLELGRLKIYNEDFFYSPRKFGLIFNNNIEWTTVLKEKYYKKPKIVKTTKYVNIYSYEINFDSLPISIYTEMKNERNTIIIKSNEAYGGIMSDEWVNNEIESIKAFHKMLNEKSDFNDSTLYRIAENGNLNFFCNNDFYGKIFEKLNNDIKNFGVMKFYNMN
ncbi:hypothetical protein [Polaribacter sp. M15]